jgi:HD-GYP domain-containing protein (c-di-GMP phosphodiesterase class II)
VSAALTGLDPAAEQLLADARARVGSSLVGNERVTRWISAAIFVVAAFALALLAPTDRSIPAIAPLLVAVFAIASRIEFEVGSGLATPTELVLVPMLFELPAKLVPLAVAVGFVVGALPELLRSRAAMERVTVLVANAGYALAPALVMLAFGEPSATRATAAVALAVALVAQFVLDAASSLLREWFALRVPPRELLVPLGIAFGIDACLAPVGLTSAAAASLVPLGGFLSMPLLVLLAVFARERVRRVDGMLELSNAYRGTAFLLGDVIEADDAYTGSHSRQVVKLVLAVADRLDLDPKSRRLAEFTALLHDVGKIKIPAAIINKPGPLTPDEREIVNTHTIEGERLLQRVGGLLGEIGSIVRSCHERWDGAGYPDGLFGESIPLIARIVCCCDAYDAMTNDRPYRPAFTPEAALEEIRVNSGTQFDPKVVAALLAVASLPGGIVPSPV